MFINRNGKTHAGRYGARASEPPPETQAEGAAKYQRMLAEVEKQIRVLQTESMLLQSEYEYLRRMDAEYDDAHIPIKRARLWRQITSLGQLVASTGNKIDILDHTKKYYYKILDYLALSI